jgi:hypothetical protein
MDRHTFANDLLCDIPDWNHRHSLDTFHPLFSDLFHLNLRNFEFVKICSNPRLMKLRVFVPCQSMVHCSLTIDPFVFWLESPFKGCWKPNVAR